VVKPLRACLLCLYAKCLLAYLYVAKVADADGPENGTTETRDVEAEGMPTETEVAAVPDSARSSAGEGPTPGEAQASTEVRTSRMPAQGHGEQARARGLSLIKVNDSRRLLLNLPRRRGKNRWGRRCRARRGADQEGEKPADRAQVRGQVPALRGGRASEGTVSQTASSRQDRGTGNGQWSHQGWGKEGVERTGFGLKGK
jgi:hypothetical protein